LAEPILGRPNVTELSYQSCKTIFHYYWGDAYVFLLHPQWSFLLILGFGPLKSQNFETPFYPCLYSNKANSGWLLQSTYKIVLEIDPLKISRLNHINLSLFRAKLIKFLNFFKALSFPRRMSAKTFKRNKLFTEKKYSFKAF
jgi:hypothetical protein